jgi:hypothetical protein
MAEGSGFYVEELVNFLMQLWCSHDFRIKIYKSKSPTADLQGGAGGAHPL